jgi:hypothetical protein
MIKLISKMVFKVFYKLKALGGGLIGLAKEPELGFKVAV